MSHGLRIGDVVRLKSGGPSMTVVALGGRAEPGVVDCVWFDRGDARQLAAFPPLALRPVDPGGAGEGDGRSSQA
jgi:uncharacterized protein YodC (DUF2158 family)